MRPHSALATQTPVSYARGVLVQRSQGTPAATKISFSSARRATHLKVSFGASERPRTERISIALPCQRLRT